MENSKYKYELLNNVHLELSPPTETGKSYLITGDYTYFHYGCDGFMDAGWGCGFRTLQSMCSWISFVLKHDTNEIPTLHEIQELLVKIGDKSTTFIGSHEWIGAIEIFYVIDTIYDISCKIQHINKNDDIKKFVNLLKNHFVDGGGLIMMGGDLDGASKGICGVHIDNNEAFLLIVDPHFIGKPKSPIDLQNQGYVRWMSTNDFVDSSFYNLCIPQLKSENK